MVTGLVGASFSARISLLIPCNELSPCESEVLVTSSFLTVYIITEFNCIVKKYIQEYAIYS